MNATVSDIDLLEKMRLQSDQEAFETIYSRHRESLLAVAYSKMRNVQSAEDIMHDVFISLWIRRKDLKINNLEGYLVRAVQFQCLTYMAKAAKARTEIYSEELPEGFDQKSPEAIFQEKFLANHLYHQVAQLPPQRRLVYLYSRDLGLNNQEIADRMAISPLTVKTHLKAALKQLRKVFNPATIWLLITSKIFY